MNTAYIFRLIQIVPAAYVNAVRLLAKDIDDDINTDGGFSVPLSSNNVDITHYAQSTVCTPSQLQGMALQRSINSDAQQIEYWRLYAANNYPAPFPSTVLFPGWSSVTASLVRPLDQPFTFTQALNDIQLVRVEIP